MPEARPGDIPDWVRAAASDPHLRGLWQTLARRYGEGGRTTRTVVVGGMDLEQRRALAELLRLPSLPPQTTKVHVTKITAAYGIDEPALRALVAELCGPIGDRAAARSAARNAREEAAGQLAATAHDAAGAHLWMDADALATWAGSQARALGGDLAGRVAEVSAVLATIATSRPEEPRLLPVAAVTATGDPHALDTDQPRGRTLDAALGAAIGVASADAATRRELRRRVGLLDDEVSSTTLSWHLPLRPEHPLAPTARLLDDNRQPAIWTLAQLRCFPVSVDACRVLVVENPSVLSTAALRGYHFPVVCTSGVPSVATLVLLDALAACGCQLDVHADLDPAGLRIVASLLARYQASRPWRMDADTYVRCSAEATESFEPTEPVEASWDPELESAMRTRRRRVFEEQLIDVLLTEPGE